MAITLGEAQRSKPDDTTDINEILQGDFSNNADLAKVIDHMIRQLISYGNRSRYLAENSGGAIKFGEMTAVVNLLKMRLAINGTNKTTLRQDVKERLDAAESAIFGEAS